MKKTFVLDTNVLLHNPEALTSFADNIVVVPIESLEYLDKFKDTNDEKGRNSRQVIRELDALRAKGSLGEGVELDGGGIIKVVGTVGKDILRSVNLNSDIGTNKILATACHFSQNGERVIFVSKDINARVKADALGVKCQDFEKEKVDFSTIWKGWREYEGTDGDEICQELLDKETISAKFLSEPMANEYWFFRRGASDPNPLMARFDIKSNTLELVPEDTEGVWGIVPRNREQRIALDLMLNDRVQLVSLMGSAGTGKTLLALAVGLAKTIDEAVYHRILVSRPIVPIGKDIGFLPGSKTEKIVNWMQPVYDNVSFIIDGHKNRNSGREMNIDYLLEAEFLELEPITYMRGRSIPRQFIIIDEAQNLTPREMKTIVTRAGTGTKMILTGDPQQIDNPYLDEDSNGLTYLVSRFHGQSEFGQILLSKSERSHLASMAAKLL